MIDVIIHILYNLSLVSFTIIWKEFFIANEYMPSKFLRRIIFTERDKSYSLTYEELRILPLVEWAEMFDIEMNEYTLDEYNNKYENGYIIKEFYLFRRYNYSPDENFFIYSRIHNTLKNL